MPKAIPSIILQNDLIKSAKTVGALMNRSAAQQIEYWASLGQKISGLVSPEFLLLIRAS